MRQLNRCNMGTRKEQLSLSGNKPIFAIHTSETMQKPILGPRDVEALNDVFAQGPNLLTDVIEVLLQCWKGKFLDTVGI